MQAEELVAVSPLHHSPLDGEPLQRVSSSPEVQNEFFSFVDAQHKIVVLPIDGDLMNLVPV